jgi:hypothetical protein
MSYSSAGSNKNTQFWREKSLEKWNLGKTEKAEDIMQTFFNLTAK